MPTNLEIQNNTFRETAKNIGDAVRRHDTGNDDPFSIRATDISPINKEDYHGKTNGSILHTNNDYLVTQNSAAQIATDNDQSTPISNH